MHSDLARIVFVTHRFADLQGLRSAGYGAAMVAGVVIWTMLPDGFRDPFGHVLLPAQLFLGLTTRSLDEYYRRWFGRLPTAAIRPPGTSRWLQAPPVGAVPFVV